MSMENDLKQLFEELRRLGLADESDAALRTMLRCAYLIGKHEPSPITTPTKD